MDGTFRHAGEGIIEEALGSMAVVGGAPSTVVVLLACLVVQIGFGGYGIGACNGTG